MNTGIRQKIKNNFKKYLFKLMNTVIFGKTMIKCSNTYTHYTWDNIKKKNYFLFFFTEYILDIEM